MSTTRTLKAGASGPLTFSIKGEFVSAHVTVGAVSKAEVTLSTDDPADSATAKAIEKATITGTRDGVHVEVPDLPGSGGITITNRGSGVVISGNVSSGMVISGGDVWVNGVHVQPGTHVGSVTTGIRAVIRLPRESSLTVRTSNSDYVVNGEDLSDVDFTSHNGSLTLSVPCRDLSFDAHNGSLDANTRIEQLDASTHNGGIHVTELHGNGKAKAHNGSITIVAKAAGRVTARAHNGNVTVLDPLNLAPTGALRVDANARNGSVHAPR